MGNPIFKENSNRINKTRAAALPRQNTMSITFQGNSGPVTRIRDEDANMNDGGRRINGSNDHPIRSILEILNRDNAMLDEEAVLPFNRHQDSITDLEEIIIRQLRPRSFSVLFGSDSEREGNGESLLNENELTSMANIMGRLRRQLRNSTIRMAQDTQLTHRSMPDGESNGVRESARDRLEQERIIRRTRMDRRDNSGLFQSAFARLSSVRYERSSISETISPIHFRRLRTEAQVLDNLDPAATTRRSSIQRINSTPFPPHDTR